jgi:hypothetical protein
MRPESRRPRTLRAISLLAATAWLAGFHAPATAQVQDDPIESRLEKGAGIDAETARAFFDALRRNVGRDERKATCEMVAFPLQHAAGVVKDAADCEARYDAIFTMAVRKAIGTQQFEELFVNQSGVMIGMGEVWFAGGCPAGRPCQRLSDIHITSVTSQTAGLRPPQGKVLLACLVSGQRISVSADGSGGAQFSMWRMPRRSGAPDLAIPRAQPPQGPSAQCGSRSWTFTDGTRTYIVSDLPCDAYLSPPPMGAVGRVTLSTPASPGTALWCFE